MNAATTLPGNAYKFTGKERDTESGLDNFGARYDSSSMGRFMTPDPLLNSGRPWAPQSWNRYAYALNNLSCPPAPRTRSYDTCLV